MKDRLREILNDLNISIEEFAFSIGVSPDLVRKYLRGDLEISKGFLRKFYKKYPEYSSDWLKSGTGEKYNKLLNQVAFEPDSDYRTKDDAMMIEKDNIIKEYKEIIQQQRNIIEHLSKLKNVKTDLDLDFQ